MDINQKFKFTLGHLVPLLFLSLIIAQGGCGIKVGNPDNEDQPDENETSKIVDSGQGGITFAITDAPVDDISNVFVKIKSISILSEAQVSSGGDKWFDVTIDHGEAFDLLALQNGNVLDFASSDSVPAGKYSQIRLILDPGYEPKVLSEDDTEHLLKVPSGVQTGIKINTNFEIGDDESTDLVLDFDLRKSIHLAGNSDKSSNYKYILKPSLRIVEKKRSYHYDGVLEGVNEAIVCAYAADIDIDLSDSCDGSTTSALVEGGFYRLSFLLSGEYSVYQYSNGQDGILVDVVKIDDLED